MRQPHERLANEPVGTVEDNSVMMGEEKKKLRKEKNEKGTKDEKDQHGNKDSE